MHTCIYTYTHMYIDQGSEYLDLSFSCDADEHILLNLDLRSPDYDQRHPAMQ